MGTYNGPNFVTENLKFGIDVPNPLCYSGSGTSLYDLGPTKRFEYSAVGNISYDSTNAGSMVFDGSGDEYRAQVDTSIFEEVSTLTPTDGLTLMCVVNPTTLSANKVINIGLSGAFPSPYTDAGYAIRISSGPVWRGVFSETNTNFTGSVAGSSTVLANTWVIIHAVYDNTAGQTRLYVNETLDATATHTGTPVSNRIYQPKGRLTLGSLSRTAYDGTVYGSTGEYWNGRIQTVFAYEKALTEEEIQQNVKVFRQRHDI